MTDETTAKLREMAERVVTCTKPPSLGMPPGAGIPLHVER